MGTCSIYCLNLFIAFICAIMHELTAVYTDQSQP